MQSARHFSYKYFKQIKEPLGLIAFHFLAGFHWPKEDDYVIIKRRDSAFLDTELRMWLQSFGINVLVFCGVDTSICVETSLRDAFNLGYDIILISDATASGSNSHYETTLARVSDYYGLQMSYDRFAHMLESLNMVRKQELEQKDYDQKLDNFIREFVQADSKYGLFIIL